MRQVQVYIEGLKIELFEDEQINVTSSVQNINDISKVFTDFSQSFTVPASTVNNQIFKHFYQSDIGDPLDPTTLFDHNIRRNALIEIDLTTFRRGKIQIEKANVKNGMPENYQLTFYGEILSLKDKFGEDKLKDLDYSNIDYLYDATEILDRIVDGVTDYDVRYPLIANTRLWTYYHGAQDITQNAHAIRFDELFPAVKVIKIFEAIEDKYGITFESSFFNDERFKKLFLWGKNTTEYEFVSEQRAVVIDQILQTVIADPNIPNPSLQQYVDIYQDRINILYAVGVQFHTVYFEVLSITNTPTFYIDVFQNGNYSQTITGDGTGDYGNISFQNTIGLNTVLTFKVRASEATSIEMNIIYQITSNLGLTNIAQIGTLTTTITGVVNLNNVMPDIKITDFFSGVLKEFNMTCVPVEQDVYQVLPLDLWYSQGAIVDITENTDLDSIDVSRVPLFKKINFKYQESESFVNKNYFKTYNQKYGDMNYQFDYDGGEYTIESPFENLLFQRSVSGNDYAILGYALNENYQAYTPKPCLLYMYGESDSLPHDIRFYNGVNYNNIDSYMLFGQDLTYQNTKYSLNFGADNSIIHNETINNGLYATYYFPYLSNLFDLKQRLVTVKTVLPISLLTSLRLNDRLIIRDKRYIINEMKSNLTTGQVDFSLYLDFRPMIAQDILNPDANSQCLDVKVNMVNGAVSADITTDFPGVTITPSTITSSQSITVCIPENTNTPSNILAENSDSLITETGLNLITENSATQVIILTVTYTLSNGQQVANQITILQE
jgi:hypothetical protein